MSYANKLKPQAKANFEVIQNNGSTTDKLTRLHDILLSGAVIENHSHVEGRDPNFPEYTLVLNKSVPSGSIQEVYDQNSTSINDRHN
ncbi:MAG: hypothetical protein R3D71_04440 [Rickettsiales bacterium]